LHLKKTQIEDGNPKCRLCGLAEETAWHAIRECGSLGLRQYTLFGINKLGQNISSKGLGESTSEASQRFRVL
jgi:hypothetical protein